MAASFGIKAWIEGGVVSAVIFLNIVIGFFQEYRAESILDSLKSLSFPTAVVIRDGKTVTVPTTDVVVGDIVEMKMGDTVPADVRLIEAVNFETDEALLTGESLPVRKDADEVYDADTGAGDRLNVAYSSTTITKGRAKGVVYAIGMKTEIGLIAASLQQKRSSRTAQRLGEDEKRPHKVLKAWSSIILDSIKAFFGLNVGTPLQRRMARLAIFLFGTAILCTIIVLAANKFSSSQEVIIYAVATGLSMIPASLLVVLTITLAAGTNQMAKRHVIVRNPKSLEALGAVTDICSDKTGTLTQGKMVARKAWIPSIGTYSVDTGSEPFNPQLGTVYLSQNAPSSLAADDSSLGDTEDAGTSIGRNSQLGKFLDVAALANLAEVHQNDEGKWVARGDPTEIAIQVFSSRFGWNRNELLGSGWRHVAEFPFDSGVKKMSVVFANKAGESYVFTKGAVEKIVASCTTVRLNREEMIVTMTDDIREGILKNMEALAGMGLRVLALASKRYHEEIIPSQERRDEIESQLEFQGLIGLYDPPRPESKGSVEQCHKAGITVHMVTGDHPKTARAIAEEVGILPSASEVALLSRDVSDSLVMTASQFDGLTDDQIDALPALPLVVARCAPSTKVRMIEALHRRERFCAMTGDGVNDSPSLKHADVGIAMGQSGSDVAKAASDIVLTDDNFASILNAVEEGRRMFDNIQKVLCHLLAQNLAQAVTLLIGLVFKDASGISVFPITPVQIMWVFTITGGTPDMGLGFEKAASDILTRPPVGRQGLFTIEVMIDMIVYGVWIGALCLSSFTLVLYGFNHNEGNQLGFNCNNEYTPQCDAVFRARATCFVCLMWFLLFLAWELVDLRRSFFYLHASDAADGEKMKKRKVFTQWAVDIWRNRFLFWAVIVGFGSVFPVLYIPVVNTRVFKHKGITWEWGVAFVAFFLFFLGVEAWKWLKRAWFRRQAARQRATTGSA
ncbi:Na+ ATPase [Arthrobotrys musiformis]|uniref:P-type Na(+) transporter n=1 Tax=Arthrobotrys musiformis TaxID=47236 RepID=A0AAV9VVL4_9PEZI